MDEQTLADSFRHLGGQDAAPRPDCPDEHELAAALDGAVSPSSRPAFDDHVADCDYCVARLGRLGRIVSIMGDDHPSEFTLVRAKRMIPQRIYRRQTVGWAAAAAVLMAVTFTTMLFTLQHGGVHPPSSPAREVRNISQDAHRLEVLYPVDGAAVDTRRPVFRWSGIEGSIYYNVRIVGDDGTMIRQERVESTEWRLPNDLNLAVPEEYYFRVDAYLTESKSVSSSHVLFRMEDPD